jgi:nitrite reductase (NADH) large subunit
MQTSDPDIYAAGECAEHDGNVYGLVAPGLEQAAIVAAHVSGEAASYRGSVPSTKLKVIGTDVFSMGDVEQLDQRTDVRTLAWSDPKAGLYRRLVFDRGRLLAGWVSAPGRNSIAFNRLCATGCGSCPGSVGALPVPGGFIRMASRNR